MSFVSSPIHRISAHPTSPTLYLASSDTVYKYNLQSSSVDATFTSPNPSYPQFLESSAEWIFISGGDKYLRVLNAQTLECVAEFPLLKRASAITYDATESSIIVADKTGEVYSFPWPIPPPLLEKFNRLKSLPPIDEKHPLTKTTDERFMGTLLLGHSSSVVACALANAAWGRALVTVDRDEHVRISVFPETWVIHAMGLGHTAFVSCVTVVGERIITGGGDNRVISWDLNGVLQKEYTTSKGSCVRLLHSWKDMIFAVGDESSMMEVLKVDGLTLVERVDVGKPILDIAFYGDMIYVSVDSNEHWIIEYQHSKEGFTQIEADNWRASTIAPTKVEIYWLESMRKKVGADEDD